MKPPVRPAFGFLTASPDAMAVGNVIVWSGGIYEVTAAHPNPIDPSWTDYSVRRVDDTSTIKGRLNDVKLVEGK